MRRVIYILLLLATLLRLAQEKSIREDSLDWCASRERATGHAFATIRGRLTESIAGKHTLEGAELFTAAGQRKRFTGRVVIEFPVGSLSGLSVRIFGPFHCSAVLKNPAQMQDGLWQLAPPHIVIRRVAQLTLEPHPSANKSLALRFRNGFLHWLERQGRHTPLLLAFEKAVWTGDLSGLPQSLRTYFREGGMAAILALSGQHVTSLLIAILALQRLLLSFFKASCPTIIRRVYPYWCEFLPVLCSSVLWILSNGAAPIARTAAMAISLWLLRRRGHHCSTLQLTTSSVALLIIWDPPLIANPSFFLSAFGTAVTAAVLNETRIRRRLFSYLVGATLLPILAWPLSAFLFAKVSWTAPLHNILLAWLWEIFLIPAGFFLPIFMALLPLSWRPYGSRLMENAWNFLMRTQQRVGEWIPPLYTSCIRPSWWEWAALELLLLFVFYEALKRQRRAGLWSDASDET